VIPISRAEDIDFYLPLDYNYIKTIQSGAMGTVVSVNFNGDKFAVKKMYDVFGADGDTVYTNEQISAGQYKKRFTLDSIRAIRQLKVMLFVDHPNLIRLVDWIEPRPDDPTPFRSIYVAMPLMDTSLAHILRTYSQNKDLTLNHVKFFLIQILYGVRYLHSAGIIHADLKPANILVNSNCDIKICDYDLTQPVDLQYEQINYIMTRWYRAPEVLVHTQKYDHRIDIWSVGCILAEILAPNEALFTGSNSWNQLHCIMKRLGTPAIQTFEGMTFHTDNKTLISLLRFLKTNRFWSKSLCFDAISRYGSIRTLFKMFEKSRICKIPRAHRLDG
jgi:mitogen-activated protein kinase 7